MEYLLFMCCVFIALWSMFFLYCFVMNYLAAIYYLIKDLLLSLYEFQFRTGKLRKSADSGPARVIDPPV
jgi:sensor histidine kinase YesM